MNNLIRRISSLQRPSDDDERHPSKIKSMCGLNANLRDYQLFGVEWLVLANETKGQHGCILGDEMGLGKTVQTLMFLMYAKNHGSGNHPYLVLAPLSVLNNWESELKRWTPSLDLFVYMGNKDVRGKKRESIAQSLNTVPSNWKNSRCPFDVFLTSYELCLKDSMFLQRFKWSVLVVDEAHRLKNSKSLLYQELMGFDIAFKVLLTGTPVQNNLQELYSLLSFINPSIFKIEEMEDFVQYFGNIISDEKLSFSDELQSLLKPFLLRRVKDEVMKELPKKSEVIFYTSMSSVQKKLYKAILTKDYGAFHVEQSNKTRLMNILLQLRKCCGHPYIFPDIEPEPFEMGDHLIEASGKMQLLDKLLAFLKSSGHRVLMFSQFTMMLDIVQDYLTYRGYTYERLDGSVRGEERYLAVNNFNESDETFIFLLSTRAGGQGLNLMTADTVIFLDNDFNPQNDLQAAARAHRIGQTRPVKVIRLVSKNTVEEIILKRAEDKLKLTQMVIEGGQFSNLQSIGETSDKIADILKFGLEDLLKDSNSAEIEEDFYSLLGGTVNGVWLLEETEIEAKENEDKAAEESMYVFEGHDYSKEPSDKDKSAFDELIAEAYKEAELGERLTRSDKGGKLLNLIHLPKRKRRELTEEEKEERRKKRAEAAAKRAKIAEEEEIRRAIEKKKRREKFWEANKYASSNIALEESESSEESEDDEIPDVEDTEGTAQINYVVGDVTLPLHTGNKDAIIIHCVDDSGRWGSGGLFTALSRRSALPKEQYELAGKMKDLALGDAHLVPVDDRMSRDAGSDMVALVVTQKRDKNNRLSPIVMTALNHGLERVQKEAKKRSASVHFPRIGHNTPNFNWYGAERLIRKLFLSKGIPTSVYYYPRRLQNMKKQDIDHSSTSIDDLKDAENPSTSKLLEIFSGQSFYFHGIDDEKASQLRRYIIAYNGDCNEFLTASTSYVITDGKVSEEFLSSLSSCTKIVSTKWLEDCISRGKLLDID